jgi:hypothetical protein
MFRPRLSREEAEALRIHEGDIVFCNGERCLVVAVGLRYVRLESLNGRPRGLVKLTYVRRVAAAEVESTSPFDHFDGVAGTFDPACLIPRKV